MSQEGYEDGCWQRGPWDSEGPLPACPAATIWLQVPQTHALPGFPQYKAGAEHPPPFPMSDGNSPSLALQMGKLRQGAGRALAEDPDLSHHPHQPVSPHLF